MVSDCSSIDRSDGLESHGPCSLKTAPPPLLLAGDADVDQESCLQVNPGVEVFSMDTADTPSGCEAGFQRHFIGTPAGSEHAYGDLFSGDIASPGAEAAVADGAATPPDLEAPDADAAVVQPFSPGASSAASSRAPSPGPGGRSSMFARGRAQSGSTSSSGFASPLGPRGALGRQGMQVPPQPEELLEGILQEYNRPCRPDEFDDDFECVSDSEVSDLEW